MLRESGNMMGYLADYSGWIMLMINRADKAALLPVQKIHSLAGIYTGV